MGHVGKHSEMSFKADQEDDVLQTIPVQTTKKERMRGVQVWPQQHSCAMESSNIFKSTEFERMVDDFWWQFYNIKGFLVAYNIHIILTEILSRYRSAENNHIYNDLQLNFCKYLFMQSYQPNRLVNCGYSKEFYLKKSVLYMVLIPINWLIN